MIAIVKRFRFSFLLIFDPQRLDVIGSLEYIQVSDLPVPTFGDSGNRCILFPVNLGELNAPFLTSMGAISRVLTERMKGWPAPSILDTPISESPRPSSPENSPINYLCGSLRSCRRASSSNTITIRESSGELRCASPIPRTRSLRLPSRRTRFTLKGSQISADLRWSRAA